MTGGAATRHLLVIGAQRSGTTYLHDLLAAHPQISMARPARPEPKVFLDDAVVDGGPEAYRATWFGHAHDGDLLGEKSTSYLERHDAIPRVRAVLGDTMIVAQLRDPIERARSNWRFSRHHGLEHRTLARALEDDLAGPTPWDPSATSVSPFAYLERGRYATQLMPWRAEFGDLVRVHLLDDLREDHGELARLLRWLGVDPGDVPDHLPPPVNTLAAGPDEELGSTLVERVRDYYRDDDAALVDLLGRPVPWRTVPRRTTQPAG